MAWRTEIICEFYTAEELEYLLAKEMYPSDLKPMTGAPNRVVAVA
jgi:hypothetical protein